MFEIAFGGVLSALCLLNLFFGWFRAFHWLQRNAPAVFTFFNNPVTQPTLMILGLVLSATGLRESLKHKHDASVDGPQKPDLGRQATATGASTAIGSMGNLYAEGNIFIGGNRAIPTERTTEQPIDISLECTGAAYTPLEIKVGHIAYVLSLNQALIQLRTFNAIDNRNGQSPIYWPDHRRTTIGGFRFDVTNHSEVSLARIIIDLRLLYGKTFAASKSIEINHLHHGEVFTIYVFNPCPVCVSMRFESTAKARLAGQTETREFPLVHDEKSGYYFLPTAENPFGETCP
jgi:hypothetical protein